MLANHEMTFVYFGIAKVQCQWHLYASAIKVQCQKLNIIGYFFSLSYISMHDMLYKWKYAKKNKSKKNQNALYMIARVSFRRCESYVMYLEGDSPHQTIMIVCECIWSSYIIIVHIMGCLCSLAKFHTQHTYSLLLLILL